MSENAAVPLVVVSSTRDPVEALNSLLRRQGIPAHCTWIPAVQDLPEALEQLNPQMLLCVISSNTDPAAIAMIRDQTTPDVPLIIIRPEITEAEIARDMAAGARDSITLESASRAHSVIARELKASRMERALHETLQSAQDYRKQLETVLNRSNDAIAQIQEGILVEANQSWLELIGAPDGTEIIGQPIMDLFEESNHVVLKGALSACRQGRWNDHSLRAELRTADGGALSLELVLTLGERDGEACVRMIVPSQRREDKNIASDLAEAVRRNPHSGLLYRQPLLEAIQKRIEKPVAGGSRYVLSIVPDNFERIERELGVFRSEQFICALAGQARLMLAPTDILGHFSGAGMLALVERGTARDAEQWAERLIDKVRQHEFDIEGRKIKASICVGLSAMPNHNGQLESVISDALDAVRARRQGGKVCIATRDDTDARVQAYDVVWVKHIQAALAENRFRLIQQPIASLTGTESRMFDMLLRMVDSQGKEILPSEFIPPAQRNDLLWQIDRWVVRAAAKFAARSQPGCLFVRLSEASATDTSLLDWLDELLRSINVEPSQICMQITEDTAARHPKTVPLLASGLRRRGLRFALEHFGAGLDPLHLLQSLPLNFVKIDGSLMQGLAEDVLQQSKVRALADAAMERGVETIAERVEDANTMAALWQLGVQHVQGYLIQSPEEVVISGRDVAARTG
ncbi:MAG: EAL domain-containing protein [Pseudomonadota bacterium]